MKLYGCHNGPRPKPNKVFSSECRYDKSLTDQRCLDCKHRGSGEAYDLKIRSDPMRNK